MKLQLLESPQLSVSLGECILTRTSLTIPKGSDIHKWAEFGLGLRAVSDAALFWVGDWRNYAKDNFEQDHGPAVEAFCKEKMSSLGYSDETIRKAQYVARLIPAGIRIPELSWGHHLFVAPKPEAEQVKWLSSAKENNWTIKELRLAMRGENKDSAAEEINEDTDDFIFDSWINKAERGFAAFPVDRWEDSELIKRIKRLRAIEVPLVQAAKERGLEVGV